MKERTAMIIWVSYLMLIVLFVIGTINFASAFEIDNVKSYDSQKKEATIKNAFGFGDEIAKIKLESELNVYVIPGKDRLVAEYTIDNIAGDYDNVFTDMEYYDLKRNGISTSREVTLKYKVKTGTKTVNDYKTVVTKDKQGLDNYEQEIIGTHEEDVYEWRVLENSKKQVLPKGNITIGIFTDVFADDKIEWIPTLFGNQRIEEWAVWTSSLNVELRGRYYSFDEASGLIYDNSTLGQNGSLVGAEAERIPAGKGKINGALNITGDSGSYGSMGNASIGLACFNNCSASAWVRIHATGIRRFVILPDNLGGYQFGVSTAQKVIQGKVGTNTVTGVSTALADKQWHHIGFAYNTTTMCLYVDGAEDSCQVYSTTFDTTLPGANYTISADPTLGEQGQLAIDELAIWNRTLSASEFAQLYNGGTGIQWTDQFPAINVALITPLNNTSFTNPNVVFLANSTGTGGETFVNSTINVYYFNGSILNKTTNSLGGTNLQNGTTWTISNIPDGNYKWNVYTCGANVCAWNNTNRTFSVDTTAPVISILAPINVLNYQRINHNLTFNWTASDAVAIDSCWIDYLGVNYTVPCPDTNASVLNITTYRSYETARFYANDTNNNVAFANTNWSYLIFEHQRRYNSSAYETDLGSYYINITYNSTHYSSILASLNYNGTAYSTTSSGSGVNLSFDRSIDIPASPELKNVFWNFSLVNGSTTTNINSPSSTQSLVNANLTLCSGAPLNVPYVNYTFKNETASQETIRAAIVSTFVYWLGSGNVNKTLSYTNAAENFAYAFCFNPSNRSINVVPDIDYYNAVSQQRTYSPGTQLLTNASTSITLFLLPTANGQFVSFQVTNAASEAIEGAFINISSSSFGSIASGTTDASGIATFFLDPFTSYNIVVSKTGFDTFTTTITPTQTSYTIVLGGGSAINVTDLTRGIVTNVQPTISALTNSTFYVFNYTISSSYWALSNFGFTLTNGTVTIGSNSSSASTGGIISLNVSTASNSTIVMNYFYVANGTYVNDSISWIVIDTGGDQWSLRTFFTDLRNYTSQGIFGINSFSLAIIIFLFIFIFVGVMSYKFSITSPAAISFIALGLVAVFDVGFGLIPSPPGVASNFPIVTIFMLIVFIVLLFREATT